MHAVEISIATVVISVLYITYAINVISYVLSQVHSSFVRLEHFSVALTKGFKKEYYWWPITELVCRYIFVISVVLSVGNKV